MILPTADGSSGQFLRTDGSGQLSFATVSSTAPDITISANNSADETVFLTFVDGATGTQGLETDTGLTYNPSSNLLSTTATAAQYADLAEKYTSDEEYEPGTIVMFGGVTSMIVTVKSQVAVNPAASVAV